jgi:hypothetical protein
MSRHLVWLASLPVLLGAACSGPAYFEGNPEGTSLEGLGVPAPDVALAQVGCSLWTSGEATTGTVVYRGESEPDDLIGYYREQGDDAIHRDVERSARPEQVGKPMVVGIDAHRQVSVVPIEGGVEVIVLIDDAPEALTCH